MRILVTGATGTLGCLLVRQLVNAGRPVRVLSRRPFRAADVLPAGVEIVEWHPDVEPPPATAFAGVETVVHLMGAPVGGASGGTSGGAFAASRIAATDHLVRGFSGRRWRLIVASIVAGSEVGDAVLTEASARSVADVAGHSEVLAAEAAALAAQSAGASVAIVRFGLLLSAGGVLGALVRDAQSGVRLNLSHARIPVIDPDDAASMLAGLVERSDIEGPVNGVAPHPLMGIDLAAMLTAVSPMPISRPLSRRGAAKRYGCAAPLLLNRARIVPQRLMEIGARFAHPDPKASAERAVLDLAEELGTRERLWQRLLPAAPLRVLGRRTEPG